MRQQVFLNIVRMVTYTLGNPYKRACSERNVAVTFDPDLGFASQDVKNVVGVFMRVFWNFRADVPMNDSGCHVQIVVLPGEQVRNLDSGKFRMRTES